MQQSFAVCLNIKKCTAGAMTISSRNTQLLACAHSYWTRSSYTRDAKSDWYFVVEGPGENVTATYAWGFVFLSFVTESLRYYVIYHEYCSPNIKRVLWESTSSHFVGSNKLWSVADSTAISKLFSETSGVGDFSWPPCHVSTKQMGHKLKVVDTKVCASL